MNVTGSEIDSQPAVRRRALSDDSLIEAARDMLAASGERVPAIGCGTSWFVAEAYAALREGAGSSRPLR
jgi:fructoselysine-6-P-deglycase FrlB-like protein